MEIINSKDMERVIPEGKKIVKTINGIDIYNMNVYENIMSRVTNHLDVPFVDYHGRVFTYGDIPKNVNIYSKGFDSLNLKEGFVVTTSLPPTVENIFSLLSMEDRGIISNNVNFLFLRSDLKEYTDNKNSDTLIILDMYLPFISNKIKETGIKNIIIVSLNDLLPKDQKGFYDDLRKMPESIRKKFEDKNFLEDCKQDIKKLKHINFIKMKEFIRAGKNPFRKIKPVEVDINRDSIYSYTSGTTGKPKCIVFKEYAANALLEMHNGLDLHDKIGDRSLEVIPTSHTTGMFYGLYLLMSRCKTMVPQPIYDRTTFASDLYNKDINHTVAAGSFWIEACNHKYKNKDALKNISRAGSGGEPITIGNINMINSWLKENGCEQRISLGGGTGELGSSIFTSYYSPLGTITNETGKPIPGTIVRIVENPYTNKEVEIGQRGYLQASSAAQADRYLDNEEATNKVWFEENGIIWYNPFDITEQNPVDKTYTMLGRDTDCYKDEFGNTQYLFDIEYSLDSNGPIKEWEISKFKDETNNDRVVAQIVLKDNVLLLKSEIVNYVCSKYGVSAVKFYDAFTSSQVTGKRKYAELAADNEGYYAPFNEDNLMYIDYKGENTTKKLIKNSEVDELYVKIRI